MRRREFLKGVSALSAALGASGLPAYAGGGRQQVEEHTFKLKYAPHFGMFKESAGEDLLDQLRFMADVGFTAFEDNGLMGRDVDVQQRIGDTLAKLGMTMGVFVIDAGDNWKVSYTTGKPEFLEPFLSACRRAIEVAKRVNAKWMTVVPGYFERNLPIGIQTGHVIDMLKRGAEILEPHGLTMVLEPLSDNPDLFLRLSDQTYMICRAVGSPACKILFDMYHMQRNEGRIIEHIDWAWNEIGYFQIGDVPGRKEPGTGEMHYQNIFGHIYRKSRDAGREYILGMEHGNAHPGADGERKLIQAYAEADSFEIDAAPSAGQA
jgi:hydroxypyruvate isomerase